MYQYLFEMRFMSCFQNATSVNLRHVNMVARVLMTLEPLGVAVYQAMEGRHVT